TAAPVATAAPAQAATAVPAAVSKFNEAPVLAALVQEGKLPPVDERLPKNPVVLDSLDGIGKYGGTIRRGFRGVSDRWGPTKIQNEGLTWYNPDFSVRANIAESWEVSDDATQWTFKLREGMKWSDGSPFTTADSKWWYENILLNDEIFPAKPGVWTAGKEREVMKAEYPDDYTAVFTFAAPKPLLVYNVTRLAAASNDGPFAPAKFLEQFHASFTDQAKLEEQAKAASMETWVQLFSEKNNWWTVDRPSIGVWLAKTALSDELFVMERNPYFWQVDSEGNQLPYVDKITHLLFETPDAFNTRIIAGEIDFQARHVSIGDFTLLKENESKGDYTVVTGITANHIAFQPNHAANDPRLREFFQNRDVRIALSLAINRAEINDLVFNGTATPRQYSPLRASPQYYEKLSNAYIEYDPARANELLDKAGYDKKNAEGFRLWKDGSGPIEFVIEGTAQAGSPDEDAVQTMVKYFADVGVKATYKAEERALYDQRNQNGEVDAAFWGGDRTLLPIVAPWIFLGSMTDRPWAGRFGIYYNDPKSPNAEAPPEGYFITKIWDIMAQVDVEPDEAKRNELFKQILDIWAEELPMIGILGELPAPAIVKNGFKGFRAGTPIDDTTEDENVLNTQTYFWEEPEKHAG
ncbi:MAG TPA: ABC transporter substrate-binding protein, partial [Roseiflexaceae bacterium]|nr:ABC transporter substrate-binding protein [Roseiflexaceae bacterium]